MACLWRARLLFFALFLLVFFQGNHNVQSVLWTKKLALIQADKTLVSQCTSGFYLQNKCNTMVWNVFLTISLKTRAEVTVFSRAFTKATSNMWLSSSANHKIHQINSHKSAKKKVYATPFNRLIVTFTWPAVHTCIKKASFIIFNTHSIPHI